MFCSSCGASITPELNYCKSCGADLGGAVKQSKTETESLIWAIVAITVGGISVIIGLLAVMKEVIKFDTPLIAIIAFLCFSMLFIADVAFIWLLLSRSRVAKKTVGNNNQLKENDTHKFYEAPARELAEPMPMPSVTEHTTRTLDAIPREQKKQ